MNASRLPRIATLLLLACPLAAWSQQIHQLAPGQSLSLQALPDNHVLRSSNGKQITVGQYKAAMARAKAGQPLAAQVKVTPGMSIATAAQAPAGTLIVTASGASASASTLAHIQKIRANISNRKADPVLPAAKLGPVVGQVGKDFSVTQALARNDNDTVKVGTTTATVAQLKYINAHLLAANQPTLEQRAAKGNGAAPKVVKVARGTDPKSLLSLPDNTILESPSGKRINVATLKAHIDKPEMKAYLQKRTQERLNAGKPKTGK
jgi:hypothetical protein